ncbi:MAG: phosphate ABC transporter substrate-binding protein [Phycisphaeraceae bacterium]|nr:MAG: phosphate ABC transporter substrate-binding protein [Phycisphaeraceae bacterium]
MRITGRLAAIGLCLLTAGATAFGSDLKVDPELPAYKPTQAVGGDLRSVGSDTMLNLMQLWAERFRDKHPAVRVQVEGKGSSTAPPALLENQSQFGPMSREMEDEEVDTFVDRFGYEPTRLHVAIDCVAVYVNKDNPIESLSLEQLKQIFSVAGPDRMTWGDVGVTDPAWRTKPITLTGRNSASGTYKYFKEIACDGDDYKPTVQENPGSAGVVNAVSRDPSAIGYSGIGYRTPDVKVVPLSFATGETAITPGVESANSGEYPLARFLNLYMNIDKRTPLDPLREEFLRLIFSADGQEAVIKDGAFPVSADIARKELKRIGLKPGF